MWPPCIFRASNGQWSLFTIITLALPPSSHGRLWIPCLPLSLYGPLQLLRAYSTIQDNLSVSRSLIYIVAKFIFHRDLNLDLFGGPFFCLPHQINTVLGSNQSYSFSSNVCDINNSGSDSSNFIYIAFGDLREQSFWCLFPLLVVDSPSPTSQYSHQVLTFLWIKWKYRITSYTGRLFTHFLLSRAAESVVVAELTTRKQNSHRKPRLTTRILHTAKGLSAQAIITFGVPWNLIILGFRGQFQGMHYKWWLHSGNTPGLI